MRKRGVSPCLLAENCPGGGEEEGERRDRLAVVSQARSAKGKVQCKVLRSRDGELSGIIVEEDVLIIEDEER